MQEHITVTGIVLKAYPVGEYDRGIVILTRERGKISAFARGARKPGSRLAAASAPFSFGRFRLYEGKSSYTVVEADIQKFFEELRADYVGACYGMYFAEVAEWYARENNDERELLKLLYQSLRALCADSLPNPLVRCVGKRRISGRSRGRGFAGVHGLRAAVHSDKPYRKALHLYGDGQGP